MPRLPVAHSLTGDAMTCSDFPVPANDHALAQCIALVQNISFVGSNHDFPTASAADVAKRIGYIHHGEQHLSDWWRTWFHPAPFVDGTTQIDVCCFFQRMKRNGSNYSVCIGFDKTKYPMGTTAQCAQFVNQFMSDASDDTFCYYVKNCLKAPNNPVYIVEMAPGSHNRDPAKDAARDALFAYLKTNPLPRVWRVDPVAPQNFTTQYKPLGEGVNLWTLTVF
jgi:hypothetical protein